MERTATQRIVLTAIHVIGWGFVFLLPLFIFRNTSHPITWSWYAGFCALPLACVLLFYTNVFVIIERTLFKKQVLRFILVNLVYIMLLGALLHMWQEFHRAHFTPDMEEVVVQPDSHPKPPIALFIGRDMLLMGLTVALSVALKITGNWYKIEREKQELEKSRTEAELKNLKSQLNPHFLFNTLNNIYSLIAINPERAQFAVQDLSRLLRHVLYDNAQDLVPLDREIEFTRSYIELMSLRLSKNTRLEARFPEGGNGTLVAPLLFIPLVENAFKHGVSATNESFIRVAVSLPDPSQIECVVENSNFPKTDSDRSGSGIGLQNLRRRLDLLYPGRYSFEAGVRGDRFTARLIIHT